MNRSLPVGWVEISLENILLSLESGNRPKGGVRGIKEGIPSIGGEHLNPNGGFNFEKIKYVPFAFYNQMNKGHINTDNILIVKDGATTGKTSFITNEFPFSKAVVNEHVFLIRCSKNIVAFYLFRYLWSAEGQRKILSNFQGAAQGGINRKFVTNTTIPLPPLNEQKRIAAKLDKIMPKIDALRERLDRIPQIIKRFRQSVLTAAVTGKLTEEWRGKNQNVESVQVLLERIKEFRIKNAANKRELNSIYKYYKEGEERLNLKEAAFKIPETWKHCEINNIGNVCNGSTPSRKALDYWGNDISWVSSGEVQNCIIKETNEKISQLGFQNSSVKLLPKGTVLIAMIGEGKTRGQAAILDIDATCNQNVAGIIINHNCVLSKYLFFWLLFQYDRNRNVGSGSGPKALNCQRVRELDFILPPFEEQKEIVRQVNKLFAFADKLGAHYNKAKEKIDKLPRAVLAKTFRGELVLQDPNDEPASELLKRIMVEKEERQAEIKKTKKRNVKSTIQKKGK